MAVGTVVRFDSEQGYGFVQPDGGGEDVFLHVRVIGEDVKNFVRPGSRVEFVAVSGERGVRAVEATLLPQDSERRGSSPATEVANPGAALGVEASEDEEIWNADGFQRELTELLITSVPSLTAAQIIEVRVAITKLATEWGWVAA